MEVISENDRLFYDSDALHFTAVNSESRLAELLLAIIKLLITLPSCFTTSQCQRGKEGRLCSFPTMRVTYGSLFTLRRRVLSNAMHDLL